MNQDNTNNMDKYFIQELTISSSAGLTKSFNVPMEYAKVKGLFITHDDTDVKFRMGMNFATKEIINKQFDSAIIRFNGFVPRKDLMYPINEPGYNVTVQTIFTVVSGNNFPLKVNLYFLVE